MMSTLARRSAAPLCVLSLVCTAIAQDGATLPNGSAGGNDAVIPGPYDLQILYVNSPGHLSNAVPGLGIPFNVGGASASAFGRPTLSSDGNQFAIKAVAATGSTATDNVLLRNGSLLLQEGTPAPWLATENVGTLDEEFSINVLGDVLLGNNTSATTNDDVIVLLAGTNWVELAREAGSTSVFAPTVSGTWDDDINSPRLTDAGGFAWRAAGIDGLAGGTANDALILLPGGSVVQKGIDVPLNQAGGALETWEFFDSDDAFVSPDGSVVLIQGDLTGATTSDDVLVMNGIVFVQEGSVIAGSAFAAPVTNIVKAWVDNGNNWYARGNNAGGDDWVLRNGVVVAESSGTDEIVAGSGEHWTDAEFSDCFFAFDGNANGEFVIAGVTDAPTPSNGVIVFRDASGFRRVVCREGDPVDLDGNGLFDDDRFFSTFGNDDVLLKNDGTIVFVATLRNAAGTSVDQGVFHLSPKTALCTQRNGSNLNLLQCTCATPPVLGTNWVIDTTVNANTVFSFVLATFVPPSAPVPLLGGEVLIDNGSAVVLTSVGTHTIGLPTGAVWLDATIYLQGVRLEQAGANLSFVLLNAIDGRLGQ